MSTRNETIYLYRNILHNHEGVSTIDMAGICPGEYVTLGTAHAEFNMASDREQIERAVEALEKAKTNARAEMQQKLTKYDEQIQNLLAITHQVTP